MVSLAYFSSHSQQAQGIHRYMQRARYYTVPAACLQKSKWLYLTTMYICPNVCTCMLGLHRLCLYDQECPRCYRLGRGANLLHQNKTRKSNSILQSNKVYFPINFHEPEHTFFPATPSASQQWKNWPDPTKNSKHRLLLLLFASKIYLISF